MNRGINMKKLSHERQMQIRETQSMVIMGWREMGIIKHYSYLREHENERPGGARAFELPMLK